MVRVLLNGIRRQLVNPGPKQQSHQLVIARNSGHEPAYRTANVHHSKGTLIGAEVVGALMWWWVTWHIFKQYDHIIGEFPYPDRSKWSNRELGVPRDNAEIKEPI